MPPWSTDSADEISETSGKVSNRALFGLTAGVQVTADGFLLSACPLCCTASKLKQNVENHLNGTR